MGDSQIRACVYEHDLMSVYMLLCAHTIMCVFVCVTVCVSL